MTMGFRGEALATISSVSNCIIETKNNNDQIGTKIEFNFPEKIITEVNRSQGTTIYVNNIFYNVPARKKFLKSPETEFSSCLEVITKYLVKYPERHWKLTHNDRIIFEYLPEDRLQRLSNVLTVPSEDFLNFTLDSNIKINGYVAKPKYSRSTKKFQFIFVNDRPINDYILSSVIKEELDLAGNQGYPLFYLDIFIDPKLVDINVHPRKSEIKFSNIHEIISHIKGAIRSAITSQKLHLISEIPTSKTSFSSIDNHGLVFRPNQEYKSFTPSKESFNQSLDNQAQILNFASKIAQGKSQQENIVTNDSRWRLIGQIHNSYIIIETQAGFLVIDQHAAAERLNYEKLHLEKKSHTPAKQFLLIPTSLVISHRELSLIEEALPFLESIGFEITVIGSKEISINAVPQSVSRVPVIDLFKGILDDFDNEKLDHVHSLEDRADRVIKYAACRGAIMFNDQLSTEEQLILLENIQKLPEDKLTCCHGRPFMKEFLKSDLEKLFHRR